MNAKKYHLRVYDNFHYGDESEAYDHGSYPTYEAAVIAAKAVVDEFLNHNWKPGINMYSNKVQGITHQIDLSFFKPEVYFITIRSKDSVITRKIVKL